jgi:hypothetical protein
VAVGLKKHVRDVTCREGNRLSVRPPASAAPNAASPRAWRGFAIKGAVCSPSTG